MNSLVSNEAAGKLLLRLTVGVLMLFHGFAKILNPDAVGHISGMLGNYSLPPVIAYGVYIGEVMAPLMIIFGIFTRISALILGINMLFAVLLVHTGDFFTLTKHGGWRLELQAFYLFGALAVVFLGSGKYAVKPD
jgi:putative oxidoreductase